MPDGTGECGENTESSICSLQVGAPVGEKVWPCGCVRFWGTPKMVVLRLVFLWDHKIVRPGLSRPSDGIFSHTPPHTFGHNSNTPTKTAHFQHSNSITQPIQLQKTHIHIPIFISYPISTSPLHSFNNNNHNYIPPQQIPPKKPKLHTNIFPFPRSQPQDLNNFSLDPT